MFNIKNIAVPTVTYCRPGVAEPSFEDGSLVEFYVGIPAKKTVPDTVFSMLNWYINSRGVGYMDALFELMYDFDIATKRSERMEILHRIIEHLDIFAIKEFLKSNLEVKPIFKDTFDMQQERDGVLTEVQTYTKDNYLDLASLVLLTQGIFGPISGILNTTDKDNHEKIELIWALETHPDLEEWPGYRKLCGYVENQLEKSLKISSGSDDMKKKILKTNISADFLGVYYTGVLLFEGLVFMDLADPECNLVSSMYGILIGKINNTSQTSNEISAIVLNSADGEDESYIESMWLPVKIANGRVAVFETASHSVEHIVKQLPENIRNYIKQEDLDLAVEILSNTKPEEISEIQLNMASIIVQYWIPERILPYLTDVNCVKNCLAVASAVLKGANHKGYGNFLLFRHTYMDEKSEAIPIYSGGTTNKTKEYRNEEMDKVYKLTITPSSKKAGIVQEKRLNPMDNWITFVVNSIKKAIWVIPEELQDITEEEFIYNPMIKNRIKDAVLEFCE